VAGVVAQVLLDVAPGDPSTEAAAGDLRGIQAVVGQECPDDR
jgi:hypothetical protein